MFCSALPLKPTLELIKLFSTDKDFSVRKEWIANAAIFNTSTHEKHPGNFYQNLYVQTMPL